LKAYKGFDKDLKCRGVQYEIGKTTTHDGPLSLCNAGLHVVEHPLDALTYYRPNDGSRYAEVEADDVSDQKAEDSKRVAKSVTLQAEIKIHALIKAAIAFAFSRTTPTTGDYAHSATTGYSAHSATTGDYAHSATTGNCAHSATTGNCAHSATTGYCAHSATTGDYAHSATTGDYAHSATTGNCAHSATTGYCAHSATTGDCAQSSVSGKQAIAVALGARSRAKGSLGNWLILAEWEKGEIKAMGIARVNGKKIKPDTWYELHNAKFTEVAE